MKKTLLTLIGLFTLSLAFAQGVTGDWYGTLSVRGTSIPLVFHITKTGDTYTATMDSPSQGAKGLATESTTFTDNQLTIDASQYKIKYSGTFLPDSNKINGLFIQGAANLPLNLTHNNTTAPVVAAAKRPQDPTDFPYKQEEVVFTNAKAGNKLAGTLTLPADGKAKRIVIMITGSGPQNRNEELAPMNHRPFLVWSDWLTRNGVAVLRYDDRGIGQSTGIFGTATSADFADDAEAAVSYVQSRADLKGLAIGLMGHSEGGMIAPIVASRNPAVKFIVLLAGPGVPISDLMLQQVADQARLSGAPDSAIQRSVATTKKLYNEIKQNPGLSTAELQVKLDTLMYRELRSYPQSAKVGQKEMDAAVKQTATLISPWYRYFICFNPSDYLMKVKCPVLALNGTMDMQVSCTPNLAAIKANLQKGNNKHFEVVPLDGLNHLFQKAKTGSVAEYSEITETVNPVALQKVSGWINGL